MGKGERLKEKGEKERTNKKRNLDPVCFTLFFRGSHLSGPRFSDLKLHTKKQPVNDATLVRNSLLSVFISEK